MPEGTVFDSTNKGTLRPNAKPIRKKGDAFKPMKLPNWGWEINLPENVSPDDPITLFTMYYTPEIIELIVQKTNNFRREPADPLRLHLRANLWYPTCSGEIYLYFAIRIYMTLIVCNEIADYWSTKDFMPVHPISSYMSRDRFQELHMRVRLHGEEARGPYAKVSKALLVFVEIY
jgi:hypothetical protein